MTPKFDIHDLRNAVTLDDLEKAYDGLGEEYEAEVNRYGWLGPRIAAEKTATFIDPASVVLDAGAGSGLVGLELTKLGFEIIDGIDISKVQLEAAATKGVYRHLLHARLGEHLPFPDDTYDAMVSAGTFTFGHAPASSFDEIVRVVRSGGYLVFTLPAEGDPEGYREKYEELTEMGRWSMIEWGDAFYSVPDVEPETQHRIAVFRVI